MDQVIVENLTDVGFDKTIIDDLAVKYLSDSDSDIKNKINDLKDIMKAIEYKKEYDALKQKRDFEDKEYQKTKHLYDEMEKEGIDVMNASALSMHMSIEINGIKVKCLLDTGAMINIISTKLVKELGLESFVDYSQERQIVGVGESKTVGLIPCIYVKLNDMVECPVCLVVMDNKSMSEAILGLPFMRHYQVVLDFKKNKMTLMGQDIKLIMQESVHG